MAGTLVVQSVVSTHPEDILTCGICLQVFKDPRILPCLHTFCFKCICSHVESCRSENRPVQCLQCREPFPDKISCLNENVFISGLTHLVEFKAVKKDECTPCGLNNRVSRAERRCLDCGDYLCSACSMGHTASSLTLHHQVVPLGEIRQGKYDAKLRQTQRVLCQHHQDKDVEYLCESCCQPACISCVVTDHKGHTIQSVAEAVTQHKSEIKCLVEAVREELTTIKAQEKDILSLINEGKAKDKAKKRIIEETAQQEIAAINARKSELLKKVSDDRKVAGKEHDSKLEEVVRKKTVTSSCVDFCERILEKGKDYELVMLETVIMERLQNVRSLLPGIRPNQTERKENCQVASQVSSSQSSKPSDFLLTLREASPKSMDITLALKNVFSGKSKHDKSKPDIKGMTYSSSIGLIISDKANKKLKVLNTQGDLRREITFEDFNPFAVAAAGKEIGAISGNCLWLITASGCLKKKIQIDRKKPNENQSFTYCLAAAQRIGYVVGNIPGVKGLYLYDFDGNLQTFLKFELHLPLAAVSLSSSGDIILSEWGRGSITILSAKGTLKWRVSSPGWKPNGNCVVEGGYMFVADYLWGGLCAFTEGGESVLQHRTTSDGLKNPICLVSADKGLLCVAGKDSVCVYDIHKK
ncbi:E3 ubiquitin-protein ligase TRIM56-like [Haliotis rubra]|uniref:E3 ubiquitin-protein ligase TRIM56-like n=1 Tax=Haliotis rubra TaxID=36100 RepID=UPI001EE54C16|nr:E3 ubiquitin-protein ligase TRIM56-like [Haliotis rubra]XP_046571165.1 E3 ubiquitin-protein ligase TRIM56-like [Haliotis rubra]